MVFIMEKYMPVFYVLAANLYTTDVLGGSSFKYPDINTLSDIIQGF